MKTFLPPVISMITIGFVIPAETTSLLSKRHKTEKNLRNIISQFKEIGDIIKQNPPEADTDLDTYLDRRNAIQLASMVQHTTGTDPTKYLKYGCYCGFGGTGNPVDELDRCCLTHDRCYGKLTADHGCSEWWRYFNTYNWRKGAGGEIICDPNDDVCKDGQCLCDKQMAECFRDNHEVYNDKYTGWWWLMFNDC